MAESKTPSPVADDCNWLGVRGLESSLATEYNGTAFVFAAAYSWLLTIRGFRQAEPEVAVKKHTQHKAPASVCHETPRPIYGLHSHGTVYCGLSNRVEGHPPEPRLHWTLAPSVRWHLRSFAMQHCTFFMACTAGQTIGVSSSTAATPLAAAGCAVILSNRSTM